MIFCTSHLTRRLLNPSMCRSRSIGTSSIFICGPSVICSIRLRLVRPRKRREFVYCRPKIFRSVEGPSEATVNCREVAGEVLKMLSPGHQVILLDRVLDGCTAVTPVGC